MFSNNIYGAFPTTTIGPFHYLYRITNLVEQKYYYGIRTSRNILPQQDLGIKYFSSSQDKNFIKDQNDHPENYRYKIIIISDTRKRVAELEIKLHNKFNVGDNPKFYNRIIQTSFGLDPTGKVCVKDEFGNNILISVNDPRYLSGELYPITKGWVTVKDKVGNNYRVSINDPRYLSGELQHIRKGKIMVKDHDGNNYSVSINDPRYLSGELEHVLKGRVMVKDHDGNNHSVYINDPRYLSGEMQHVRKGKMTGLVSVKDNFGNSSQVSIKDPRYLSGELKSITSGSKWIHNPKLKQNKRVNSDFQLPEGWVYGRKIYNNVTLGSKFIHNIDLKQNKRLKLGCPLPDGWEYGMRRTWD